MKTWSIKAICREFLVLKAVRGNPVPRPGNNWTAMKWVAVNGWTDGYPTAVLSARVKTRLRLGRCSAEGASFFSGRSSKLCANPQHHDVLTKGSSGKC